MSKYRVWIQKEPFHFTDPRCLVVEAEDEADAYLAAYDQQTKCGLALNTSEPFSGLHNRFSEDMKRKIVESGLPNMGYPAMSHITRIEKVLTGFGKGTVLGPD